MRTDFLGVGLLSVTGDGYSDVKVKLLRKVLQMFWRWV